MTDPGGNLLQAGRLRTHGQSVSRKGVQVMDRRRQILTGVLLLLAGIFFLALNLGWLPDVGPFVPLLLGLGFLALFLITRVAWAVFPGSFLVMLGLVIALIATNAVSGELAWPGFILGPGLAFFLIAALAPVHREWAYVPGSIVSLVGAIFLLVNTTLGPQGLARVSGFMVPLALIAGGAYLLLFRKRPR